MEKARRQTGKPVVLVGDLNIARRPQDSFFKDRLVHVDSFLKSSPPPGLESLWTDLTRVWGDVVERLGNRQARKQTTYAPSQVLTLTSLGTCVTPP
jgi:exonuclease III